MGRRPGRGASVRLAAAAVRRGSSGDARGPPDLRRTDGRGGLRDSAGVVSRSDGTALREAWRQFLFATIAPVSKLVELELSAKLDVAVTLTHEEMRASDLAARARAFQSMVGGGMDPAKAAGLAGLMAD